MNTDSALDLQVKGKVLADLFTLAGIRAQTDGLTADAQRGETRDGTATANDSLKTKRSSSAPPSFAAAPSTPASSQQREGTGGAPLSTKGTECSEGTKQQDWVDAATAMEASDVSYLTCLLSEDAAPLLDGLSVAEKRLLLRFAKEVDRSSGFQLLFPTVDYQVYKKLFEEERPSNVLLKRFLSLYHEHKEMEELKASACKEVIAVVGQRLNPDMRSEGAGSMESSNMGQVIKKSSQNSKYVAKVKCISSNGDKSSHKSNHKVAAVQAKDRPPRRDMHLGVAVNTVDTAGAESHVPVPPATNKSHTVVRKTMLQSNL